MNERVPKAFWIVSEHSLWFLCMFWFPPISYKHVGWIGYSNLPIAVYACICVRRGVKPVQKRPVWVQGVVPTKQETETVRASMCVWVHSALQWTDIPSNPHAQHFQNKLSSY